MELVFFYINQTSSKFIEKKGINFSANYDFYVEYSNGKYVLKQNACKDLLPENFFDEQVTKRDQKDKQEVMKK